MSDIQSSELVQRQIAGARSQFLALLPPTMPVARFQRSAANALLANPDLDKCDPRSLMRACMDAARQGLLPDGKEGAIVPFAQKNGPPNAVFLPMVAGLIKRLHDTGQVANVQTNVVHERDVFEFEAGDDERLRHVPTMAADRGEIVAAYAVVKLTTGANFREVLRRDEIDKVRASSRAADGPAWRNWFGEMAKKTALRRLAKRLPFGDPWADRPVVAVPQAVPSDPDERRVADIEDPQAYLQGARSTGELDQRWRQILRQLRANSAETPLAIEASYHERRETLAQLEANA